MCVGVCVCVCVCPWHITLESLQGVVSLPETCRRVQTFNWHEEKLVCALVCSAKRPCCDRWAQEVAMANTGWRLCGQLLSNARQFCLQLCWERTHDLIIDILLYSYLSTKTLWKPFFGIKPEDLCYSYSCSLLVYVPFIKNIFFLLIGGLKIAWSHLLNYKWFCCFEAKSKNLSFSWT